MPENVKKETSEKKDTIRVAKFSRRQFLKRASVVAAGAAVASISLTSACKSSGNTGSTTTGVNPTTTTTSSAPPSSTTPSSGLPTSSATAPTSVAPTATSTIPSTSTPAATGYSYVPPTGLPPLITVTGTTCTVATDRLYSADNIWVKSLSADIVAMGITPTMVEILYEPYNLSLSQVGTVLASEDAFGTIEGYKMTADLISPVSGTLIQVNNFLAALAEQGSAVISPINDDPYNSGWMVVIQLSKPSELNALLTPQSYSDLIAKK